MKLLHILVLLVLIGCARQVPLTGGLKDLDPPKVISSTPENQALNFEGQKIVLEFDEYVRQENLLNQLIITPRINGTYKTRVNKNLVTLDFDEPFDSATTYTLNFREGIKDITEGNVPPNMTFVFSTGSYLDSVSISGSVKDLLTQEILEDITISLYNPDDTVNVFNGTPQYLTKTNTEGKFTLQNIKNGPYLIYAINDDNQNLKLETRTEAYAFLNDVEDLQDSTANINFQLFPLDNREIKMISSRPVGKNFDIFFNKSIKTYNVINSDPIIASNLIDENKALRLYQNGTLNTDSSAFHFQAQDSLGQIIDTTVYVKFQPSDRKPAKLISNFNLKDGAVDKLISANLTLNKPIRTVITDSISVQLDSLNSFAIPDSMIRINNHEIDFEIDTEILFTGDSIFSNWSQPFELMIPKGTIITVEQDTVPELNRDLFFKKSDEYGLVAGDITTAYEYFELQLINEKYEPVQQIQYTVDTPRTFIFKGVEPGEYSMRVFVDLNGNGSWDPGNINTLSLPEPVILLFHPNMQSEKIIIRANWEQRGVMIAF